MDNAIKPCELCLSEGGTVLWRSSLCRVVRVLDPDYPGFCRVIWTAHQSEMTDLEPAHRHYLMNIVFALEQVIRSLYSPHKVNLASFGNMTPHLHWHVIPRWTDDRHFPEPIWGSTHNAAPVHRPDVSDAVLMEALARNLPSEENHG